MLNSAGFIGHICMMEGKMNRRSIRSMRQQAAYGRASRNMRALNRMSRKEMYVRGIGQGIIFLLIGGVLLALNMQKVGGSSLLADWQGMPAWAQFLGGGITSFGLCWAVRDACLLFLLLRAGKQNSHPSLPPDQAD